ncbi:unnamed protein product, partial [Ranitomeya imitator]
LAESLTDLLRSIVANCPSVCDKNHFAALLGAYGATLGVTDQKILLLLRAYEQNNLSLTDFRLLLWGPAAVEHHKTRKSLGKSLWQQPSMEEILTLLDREKMMKTILNFPLHRKLTAEEFDNTTSRHWEHPGKRFPGRNRLDILYPFAADLLSKWSESPKEDPAVSSLSSQTVLSIPDVASLKDPTEKLRL